MLSSNDFKLLAKQTNDAQLKIRYLALYHFTQGKSRSKTAEILAVARGSVNTWVAAYLSNGVEALHSQPRTGRTCNLTESQLAQLCEFIESYSAKKEGGRLIAEDIRRYISKQFAVDYQLRNVYRLLHAQGLSWITCRSMHPKCSDKAQEAFKKLPTGNDP